MIILGDTSFILSIFYICFLSALIFTSVFLIFLFFLKLQELIFYFITHLFQLTVLMNTDVTLMTQSLVVNVAWQTNYVTLDSVCMCVCEHLCCVYTDCVCVTESSQISFHVHGPTFLQRKFCLFTLFTVINSESSEIVWLLVVTIGPQGGEYTRWWKSSAKVKHHCKALTECKTCITQMVFGTWQHF